MSEMSFYDLRINTGFSNKVDLVGSNIVDSSQAQPYLLTGVDIVGHIQQGHRISLNLSNGVLTASGNGQVDWAFALQRVEYSAIRISVDVSSATSSSTNWVSIYPYYIDSNNVAHNVRATPSGADFSFLGSPKHFEFTYTKEELPYADYWLIAFGNLEYGNILVSNFTITIIPPATTANGGGATHIAKRTGLLKDLSSYTSDILLVSGGGGGGLIIGEDTYAGADGGGISGSGNNSANQTTGYAFGQGESSDSKSGGGGGLYGGYKGGTS